MRFPRPPAPAAGSEEGDSEHAADEETPAAPHIPPWHSFFFPFSECGPRVESFQVQINQIPVFGEVVRARRRDGRLIPATEKAAFLAETSDVEDEMDDTDASPSSAPQEAEESGEGVAEEKTDASSPATAQSTGDEKAKTGKASKVKPLLYYYIVDPVHMESILQQSGEGKEAKSSAEGSEWIDVEVTWRCRIDQLQGSTVYVPYSFYCAPCRPQRLTCYVELDKNAPPLKGIKSPNCQQNFLYLNTRFVKERRAAHVAVETVQPTGTIASALSEKEDLFLFAIQLGERVLLDVSEEVSFAGITVVVMVLLLVIWFLLTKDLTF
ncbi:hypothetical protein STCU_10451 [Strigomonas culicis]|uniref:Transmembrane protein n=1 Tax=Strigomonas culicis TaxID=28005 RepID=S9TLN5_9TRYP|nr:hypothetical protein STCU_10451 [Strigomonas culicis]|eukprot:EPY17719.1 hypothetical protein STCU_10451 [Strigomonas culicis]